MRIDWGELASVAVANVRGEHRLPASSSQELGEDEPLPLWLEPFRGLPWLTKAVMFIENIGRRLMGWASGLLKGIGSWSLSAIWGALQTAKNFVWNFNLLATDEELEGQIKALQTGIASQLGSTVGYAFGYAAGMLTSAGVAVGIAAIGKSMGIPLLAFDKALLTKALKKTTEEGFEELVGMLTGLTRALINYGVRQAGTSLFINIRKYAKYVSNNPAIRPLLSDDVKKAIDEWGETSGQFWSLAHAVEERVDSIDSDFWRSFFDSAIEEADEGFIEAGFIFAANLDSLIAEKADLREAVLGTQQVIEIVPDREAPNERIVVAGREQTVRATVMQTLATHQLVQNRDVGQIVGQPANEQMLQQAPTTTLTLRLMYYPVQSPPFSATAMQSQNIQGPWTTCDLKIPYIDPVQLDWEKIKRAAGLTGRLRGRYRCYGYLAGRKIEVYGATENDAEQWLRDLASLSEAHEQLTGIGFSRRRRNPASSSSLSDQYESVRVWPAYAIILSQKLARDKQEGRPTLQGNFTQQSQRIELWPDTEPAYTREILQAMKAYHTPLELLGIGFRRP